MPITPLHLGAVWPIYLLRRRLSFTCLSIGAMVPDLEVAFLMLFFPGGEHSRGLMHSLLGALTFDILVALFFAYFILPPLGRWLKAHTRERWHVFAGTDFTLAPRNPGIALLSAGIGTLSHVFLDLLTHRYTPLFWPCCTDRNINLMPFPDQALSALVISIPLFITVFALAVRYWSRPYGPLRRH